MLISQLHDQFIPKGIQISKIQSPKFPINTDTKLGEVDYFANETYFEISLGGLLISILTKKTPYTSLDSEGMFYIRGVDNKMYSQVTEFDRNQRNLISFFCEQLVNAIKIICNHDAILSANQQQECVLIPAKFDTNGVEVKVQTINGFHMHFFPNIIHPLTIVPLDSLELLDQQDFYDIYGADLLADYQTVPNSNFYKSKGVSQLGIMESLLEFHLDFSRRYYNYTSVMGNKPTDAQFTIRQNTFLNLLQRPTELSPKFYPIQGPAFTYLYDHSNGSMIAPRMVSRGNAMEAMYVWVDQCGLMSDQEVINRRRFFEKLYKILGTTFTVTKSKLLNGTN